MPLINAITIVRKLFLVWMLFILYVVSAQNKPATNAYPMNMPQPAVVQLRSNDVTTIVATRGVFSGNVNGKFAVIGFDTPKDVITWTVNAPKEDDYAVSIIYSMEEQKNIEIRCGESVLLTPSITRTWENRPFHWRQEISGTLHLKMGINNISLRLPDVQNAKELQVSSDTKPENFGNGVTKAFHLFSIELGTPSARKAQLSRANEIRGDASWMTEGKYGLFIHWSALSHPYYGDQPRAEWFQKSVEIFDVKVFADAIERTGAAWITFTATHKGFYWPGPNKALDKVLLGRTAKRDLLGEIIDELDKRGIRTLFYLHTGYNGYESEFRKAAGAEDADKKRYSDNIEAILRECSLRYGKKLHGFGYIDGALSHDYPLDPSWEGWARATKAGNPKAIVGFSSNRGPTVSPFSELTVTDGGNHMRYPDAELVGSGKQLGDVTTAWWCLMDRGGWFARKPMNGKISGGPIHSTEEYVDFFQKMAEAKIPITINLMMTADVTDEHPIFNPECMAVMEEVRKVIRGK